MPAASRSPFVFALGQPGAERALRAELLERGLSPAFGLGGFVSAKGSRSFSVDELPDLVLGRRVCLALGKVALPGQQDLKGCVDVDAVVRDTGAVLHREHGERGPPVSVEGRCVVTVVERPGGTFVGLHRHRAGLSPDPCGDPRLEVPEAAPSRAWLKLEEAMRLVPLPIAAGDVVIEVGCAPGGQTRALLDRGCVVIGVDPNAMDERLLKEPRFTHLRSSARHIEASLLKDTLPGPARFIVVDVNQRPQAALSSTADIVAATRSTLRGGLFTLKLGDWSMLPELPQWRRRIEQMFGPGTTTLATQLPANRQELTVIALRSSSSSLSTPASGATSSRGAQR